MTVGQTNGDNAPALSIDSAASVFEGLLSAEEEKDTPTTPPAAKKEPADEPDDEDVGEVDDPAEETEEEDTPDEPVVEPPKLRKVKVDGAEIEVTEEELEKGYSRTADYTRKTQAHAETVKQFSEHEVAVRSERLRNAELFTQLEDAIKSSTPAEPDWDTLRTENPAEFAAEWAAWQQFKQRTANITAQKDAALAKVKADQNEAKGKYLEAERTALVEAIPEWKDAAVQKKDQSELIEFAKAAGYTDADLDAVTDHRVVKLLRQAMLYEKSQKAKPSVRQKIEEIKAATPGPAQKSTRRITEIDKRRARLKSSGRVQDAAALFETILDAEEK